MNISSIFHRAPKEPDHAESWPERSGEARVLVEHPDTAESLAHAETLRRAGYDAAVCPDPTANSLAGRGRGTSRTTSRAGTGATRSARCSPAGAAHLPTTQT
jgi:hypothetical protein